VSSLADLAHGPGVARVLAIDDLLVRVSRLGGPLLAAGVAALWSLPAVLVADAVSFGLAAALAVAVPVARIAAADDAAGLRRVLAVVGGLPDVAAGWRLRGVGCFVWGSYSVGVPLLVNGIPGSDVAQLAAITGGYAVGSLLGSGVLSMRPLRGQLLPVVCAAWAGVGVAFMVMGASGVLAVLVGAAALAGTMIPAANVSVTTLVAHSTEGALRRSALGAQAAVVNGSGTAGLVAVGALLGVAGPGTVMLASGAVLVAVSGFVFLRSRSRPQCRQIAVEA
jgi:hypothetical protein